MIKVSVIVPVYNTSKYLDKCINSLVNQTLEEMEVLMIVKRKLNYGKKKISV